MTPRQLFAWLDFQERVRRKRMSESLVISAIATRGKENAVDKMLADLAKPPKG